MDVERGWKSIAFMVGYEHPKTKGPFSCPVLSTCILSVLYPEPSRLNAQGSFKLEKISSGRKLAGRHL